ncbi:MAG: hypothetical protein Q4G68_12350 [Planctomycetia bacterium]|nr:hypothetical protein [Planctomycetia bacterium]
MKIRQIPCRLTFFLALAFVPIALAQEESVSALTPAESSTAQPVVELGVESEDMAGLLPGESVEKELPTGVEPLAEGSEAPAGPSAESLWPAPSPVLVQQAPLVLRRYVRFLFDQKDLNRDHVLNEAEWSFIPAGQALDLNGDFLLEEEEVLYFLTNYASGRTIFRPDKPDLAADSVRSEAPPSIRPVSGPVVLARAEESQEDPAATSSASGPQEETDAEDQETDDLAGVEDPDLLKLLVEERDGTVLREYVVPSESLQGVPRWFIVRDINGDGQLSLRELAPSLSVTAVAFFGELDSNSDGFITPDEMRSNLASRKKK